MNKQQQNFIIGVAIVSVVLLSLASGYRARIQGEEGDGGTDLFETLFGESEGAGTLGVALTIVYKDGSTKEADPTTMPLSFFKGPESLTILDETGKEIESVNFVAKAKVTWTGTKVDDEGSGDVWVYVNGNRVYELDYSYSYTRGFVNGEYVTLCTGSIGTYYLDKKGNEGTNELRIRCKLTARIQFDSNTDEMKGDGSAYLDYNKDSTGGSGEITAVQMLVMPTVINK